MKFHNNSYIISDKIRFHIALNRHQQQLASQSARLRWGRIFSPPPTTIK